MSLVNISIDDVSPHKESSICVLERCSEILEVFPEVKFTLFVPTGYWRTITHTTQSPLLLSEHKDFCDFLRSLDPETYEIGYHGHYHGMPGTSNNDEMRSLSFSSAVDLVKTMKSELTAANLDSVFKPILRPPAWRISHEAMNAVFEEGITTLALHPDPIYTGIYGNGIDTYAGNIVWCNVNPPFTELKEFEQTEIVYHACEWDKNYLDDEKTQSLIRWLSNRNCEFAFIDKLGIKGKYIG